MNRIRKISYGPNYKDCMHITVGQEVMNGENTIHEIMNPEPGVYDIYIKDTNNEVRKWKSIESVPVHVEYDINY